MATAVISASEAMHYIHILWHGLPILPATVALLALFMFLALATAGNALHSDGEYVAKWEGDNAEGLKGAYDPDIRDKELEATRIQADMLARASAAAVAFDDDAAFDLRRERHGPERDDDAVGGSLEARKVAVGDLGSDRGDAGDGVGIDPELDQGRLAAEPGGFRNVDEEIIDRRRADHCQHLLAIGIRQRQITHSNTPPTPPPRKGRF